MNGLIPPTPYHPPPKKEKKAFSHRVLFETFFNIRTKILWLANIILPMHGCLLLIIILVVLQMIFVHLQSTKCKNDHQGKTIIKEILYWRLCLLHDAATRPSLFNLPAYSSTGRKFHLLHYTVTPWNSKYCAIPIYIAHDNIMQAVLSI